MIGKSQGVAGTMRSGGADLGMGGVGQSGGKEGKVQAWPLRSLKGGTWLVRDDRVGGTKRRNRGAD